ncbi:transposase [Tolypothrix campylonemoides VB511288_2]|uniref:Transposase n=2 Tax=Nostocales TaxID=1161 RepID=A0ABW8WEJ3_9CYAN|nr:transposase [Tolypothrix bouteillei]
MLKTIVKNILPIDVKNLRSLGIDEISLVKGQGKFIVVLVDLETHKLIGLVSERKQVEIEKVMRLWGENVLSQIEEVSMDMTGNYKSKREKNLSKCGGNSRQISCYKNDSQGVKSGKN